MHATILSRPAFRARLADSLHFVLQRTQMPLPELLASGALAKAFQQVDWAALGETLGNAATRAIKSNFENDDGSIQWGKVAASGAIAATTIAAALDATDDGNRTSELLKFGSNLLSWWTGDGQKDGDARRRDP